MLLGEVHMHISVVTVWQNKAKNEIGDSVKLKLKGISDGNVC